MKKVKKESKKMAVLLPQVNIRLRAADSAEIQKTVSAVKR